MTNSKNNIRNIAIATVALFTVVLTNTSAKAEDGKNVVPVNLTYLGAANNAPIFELTFTNKNVEEFEITVTDKFNTIFSENVKGKGLVRKYQFVSNELNGASAEDEITVSIKNTVTKNVKTYKLYPGAGAVTDKELVAVL